MHSPNRLTKFDVAERQLHQAIQIFFGGGDLVSVLTLSEAATEVLFALSQRSGLKSVMVDNALVRVTYKTRWLDTINKARNFLKHADKDPYGELDLREELIHFSLLDAIALYHPFKHGASPETFIYFQWFAIRYPELIVPDERWSPGLEQLQMLAPQREPGRLSECAQLIAQLRSGAIRLPSLVLEPGRPKGRLSP
ncbi:hypothetical protein ACSFA0_22715 [Variovorax sp. LT1P1]|uniref:hypothetical protein n=1 Tax=Variovorax sp. LT1P1 TaxID=3443730 RepID=UPI003F463AE1